MIRLPRPTTPLGRAVLPVVGGALLLAAIFGMTWLIAAWMSNGNGAASERLAPSTFPVGDVESVSEQIAESGPLLFPNLDDSTAERSVVLDHRGDDPTRGWRVSWGYPADGASTCHVTQVEGTARFTDCNGREIGVDDLARDDSLCPIVEAREDLSIGLRAEVCSRATTPG